MALALDTNTGTGIGIGRYTSNMEFALEVPLYIKFNIILLHMDKMNYEIEWVAKISSQKLGSTFLACFSCTGSFGLMAEPKPKPKPKVKRVASVIVCLCIIKITPPVYRSLCWTGSSVDSWATSSNVNFCQHDCIALHLVFMAVYGSIFFFFFFFLLHAYPSLAKG